MNINEIARLAGVSRATVSRYMNNGYVSEEKKERNGLPSILPGKNAADKEDKPHRRGDS